MRHHRLFVLSALSAVAAMSASAVAHAGDIDSPREARAAINAMNGANASLSKAIQAAEEKTGGTAFRVELASHVDVLSTYDTAARRSMRSVSTKSDKNSESNKTSDKSTNDKSIDRDAPHAKVQCLVNGKRIRCALVNLKSGEVVRVRNIGHDHSTDRSNYTYRGRDHDRTYGDDHQDRYGDQNSRVNRNFIEQNAWPPQRGDRYYDEYAADRYDDRYDRRPRGQNVRYDGDSPDRYSGLSDNRYNDRYDQNRGRYSSRDDDRFDRRDRTRSFDRFGSGLVLASDLMNANVRNIRDQDLGGIENLAIDPNSACLVYASLAHGGLLGLGQKHFAIPPQELTLGRDGNVYLDVQRRELQNRDGFDATNWPKQADMSFSSDAIRYDHDPSQKQQAAAQKIVKASKIIGHDVVDSSGNELGEVDDLVVDPSRGKVAYLVVEVDDDLWEHEFVVVPAGVVQMNDDKCVINVAKAQFESMPTFSENNHPNWNDRDWNRRAHARFNVPPYWDDDRS